MPLISVSANIQKTKHNIDNTSPWQKNKQTLISKTKDDPSRISTTVTVCNNPNIAIPDNDLAGINNTIIFNQDLTITDVDVTINANHTFIGDLAFTLTNDGTNTSTIIIDRPGVPVSNFGCGSDNINTTIDDDNGTAVENECNPIPPAIGAGPFTGNNVLSTFDGQSSLNNWTLNVSDAVGQDMGTLVEWCVVITGDTVAPDILFSTNSLTQDVCVDSNPTAISPITLNLTAENGFSNLVTLAFNPALPTGFSGGFSLNPVTPIPAPGVQSLLNLDINNTTIAGINNISIEASAQGITNKILNLGINVSYPLNTDTLTTSPTNGAIGILTNTGFSWAAINGANSYDFEISTDPAFNTTVISTNVAVTTFTPAVSLLSNTAYFWRVRARNICGTTNYANAAIETIGTVINSTSTTCSTPALAITDNDLLGINDTLQVAATGMISDIDIILDVTHTFVGDIIANVQNDSTATNVTIMDRPGFTGTGFGCAGDDINTTIDDAAAIAIEGVCDNLVPTIGAGPFSANNPLSIFNLESSAGNWTLNISDNAAADIGVLNQWCVVATVSNSTPAMPADYSDLSGTYGVAKHEGTGTSRLGSSWTADISFSQDSDVADDDGITASGIWLPNSLTAQLSIDSTGGFVACWFDWNNDGSFSSTEKSIAQNITQGVQNIAVTIPLTSSFGSNGDDFLESRCRFYIAEPILRATETATGVAGSGEVEDYRFNANQLTPITLAFSSSRMRNNRFNLDWSTTTEAGTIAFNILGLEANTWVQLNDKPIRAKGINSVLPQDYHFEINNSQIQSYKIQELTSKGTQHHYGPFASNLDYGKQPQITAINWQQIRAESDSKKQQRQAALKDHFDLIKIKVNENGIQRISQQQLAGLGVDWQGVAAADISIRFEDHAVARYVSADIFAEGEYIEFIGKAADSQYSKTNVYELSINAAEAKVIIEVNAEVTELDESAYYIATNTLDVDLNYSFASPAQSPWFNRSLLVFTEENSWQFPLNALNSLDNGAAIKLQYSLWGGTDWPQQDIDHHFQLLFNNQLQTEVYGDGLELFNGQVEIQSNQLQENNIVTITLPADTGVDFDLLQLDELAISYPAQIQLQQGKVQFTPIVSGRIQDRIFKNTFELTSQNDGFKVKGLTQNNITAYAYTENNLYHFSNINNNGSEIELPYLNINNLKYIVTQDENINQPEIELARTEVNILPGQHDYLIITHPDFKPGLSPLINYHENQGRDVVLIDVQDIYAQYSSHRIEASAIKSYIKEAQQQMGIKAVMLVGSDSYDYLNNLNIGSISYIPTLYRATDDNIRFAPVDSLYADTNNDLIPDLAIGRLPVRTGQELQNMIDKTMAFANRQYTKSAIFSSDRDTSFDRFSDQMIDQLPLDWQVETAYINQLELVGAKSTLINGIENGVTFTSFFGHSGPSSWSFERLFDRNDVLVLNNINRPTMINQFGCWNTYYVVPQFNTMAHAFMQADNRGAVAVMGASTLTESFHESELSKLLIPQLTQANNTIGQAILNAKQQLASNHPEYLDVILGWTLLGDPLLQID
jgi:subtilisin-like proprotein convertase family protein